MSFSFVSRAGSALPAAVLLLAGAASTPAAATAIDGLQVMREHNLVVLGSAQTRHDVEGRTYVGGSLAGTGTFNKGGSGTQAASTRPVLTVGGSIGGGYKNIQGGGTIEAGGSVEHLNLNGTYTVRAGGAINIQNRNQSTFESGANVSIPYFAGDMYELSTSLAALADTGGSFGKEGQSRTVNPVAVDGVAVMNVADLGALLASNGNDIIGSIKFANGSDAFDTIVMNVGGTSFSFDDNFIGGSIGLAGTVIWNFYEATTLAFNREFFGSVLAPLAHITNNSPINGTGVFGSATLNGEMHLSSYGGTGLSFSPPVVIDEPLDPVPAPGALALLALGLGGIALRRRAAPAVSN
ncbi:collagen-binding domain-containing protein [Pacificimonas flava]|uniref:collagen-binding domain-containing protein n=1 Tax=Pacificimonas flava TaxID=1234595 RepID=UPI00135F1B79|nr:collagen-binding domain-containing protein [Pacificimonas flava]MBB5280207.1 choice-of-anchor A domain-containing protein [Pacificimonas flava]